MGLNKTKVLIIFSLLTLSSCSSGIKGTYKEVNIENNDNNIKIEKSLSTNKNSPVLGDTGTIINKKENGNNSFSGQSSENLQMISLNNLEKIKKIENIEKYNYEKLSDGITIESILNSSIIKRDGLSKTDYLGINGNELIKYDKSLLEMINKNLSNQIFNKNTIYLTIEELSKSVIKEKKVIDESYIDIDLKQKTKKVLKSQMKITKDLKIFTFDEEKYNKYLSDKNIVAFYLNGKEIYPIYNNGITGYLNYHLINLLIIDKKAGILQYLPDTNELFEGIELMKIIISQNIQIYYNLI